MIEENTNGYTRGVKFSQILEYLKQNSTHQNNQKEQYQSETKKEEVEEKEEEYEKEEHFTTQIQIEQQQEQQQIEREREKQKLKQKQQQLVFEQNQNFINVFVENETLFFEDLEFPLNSCCYLEESENPNSNKLFGSLVKITPMEIVIRFMSMGEVRVLISQLAVGQYHLSQ
ncbi:hypothetical protein M0813_27402 [Anaeramoeba flamelloides]|uniref:Uncharacterized protein n=1 Tax=Anaeramoeba flamelloides TaxID=1746091 RepID=A0ABQ8XXV7_9EUKA|nr:hypothetical protein M0813_27402 [Anaeramoeba flamelloides]